MEKKMKNGEKTRSPLSAIRSIRRVHADVVWVQRIIPDHTYILYTSHLHTYDINHSKQVPIIVGRVRARLTYI